MLHSVTRMPVRCIPQPWVCRNRMRRLVALSSTTSTFRPYAVLAAPRWQTPDFHILPGFGQDGEMEG